MIGPEVFVPVGLAAAALFIGGIAASVTRSRALDELAATHRWDRQKRDAELPKTFFGGRPFDEGHGRVAHNVLRGRHNDRSVLVFDYVYKTPGNDGDDTHRYWVACVEDLPAPLPAPEVAKRRLLGRSGRFGVEVRTGDAAFDDRYRVAAASPQLAADLLVPEVVRLVMGWPDFPWRIEGTRLVTWGKGTVTPHWIEPTLNMLCTLAGAIPQQVWRNVGGLDGVGEP